MRGIDDQQVHARVGERARTLPCIGADADCGADAQPALRILRRLGEFDPLLDVLDRDEPGQPSPGVDDRQLLDLLLMQDGLGFRERRPDRRRDQIP